MIPTSALLILLWAMNPSMTVTGVGDWYFASASLTGVDSSHGPYNSKRDCQRMAYELTHITKPSGQTSNGTSMEVTTDCWESGTESFALPPGVGHTGDWHFDAYNAINSAVQGPFFSLGDCQRVSWELGRNNPNLNKSDCWETSSEQF